MFENSNEYGFSEMEMSDFEQFVYPRKRTIIGSDGDMTDGGEGVFPACNAAALTMKQQRSRKRNRRMAFLFHYSSRKVRPPSP